MVFAVFAVNFLPLSFSVLGSEFLFLFFMIPFFLFFAVVTVSAATQGPVMRVPLAVDLDHPIVIPNFSTALGGAIDGHEEGATILSKKNVAAMLTAGLKPLAYRLRTELGVEAWHWNPAGTWSDGACHQGYWTSSEKMGEPILKSYGYRLPRRGDTLDEANNDSYSRLDDGNTTTFWKSNPYLTSYYTGETDAAHPQWVVLDFGKKVSINAGRLHWKNPYAKKFRVQYARGGNLYFGHNKDWHTFPKGEITHSHGGSSLLDLGMPHDFLGHPIEVQFVRILMTESSGEAELGNKDPRDQMGYALQEVELGLLNNGSFHDQVIHRPDQRQTMVTVSSTDPWHRACDRDEKTEQPGLDAVATSGLGNNKPILWSLPVLYDTPENAVAAVAYLKKRNYFKPYQKVELGEEPDGQHSDPKDFGALYCQVASRLHGYKLTLGGPSFVTIDCQPKDTTYRFDHRPWLKRFFQQLRRHQQQNDFQFLTFEWYPFDELLLPPAELLCKQSGSLRKAVTLIRHGGVPSSMPLIITEYGYSVFSGEPEVKLEAALLNADIAAEFLLLGGETSYLYGYEPNSLECGYGNSWGNLMMFLQNNEGGIPTPLPTYYGAQLLTRAWGTPARGEYEIYTASCEPAEGSLTAYMLHEKIANRWSLLLVNKNPMQSFEIGYRFMRHGKKTTAPWKPSELLSYSSSQYQWHADGVKGYPLHDEAPQYQKITQHDVVIKPWSMMVMW